VAQQKKITLPNEISIDTEIELLRDTSGFFLRAKMAVSIPGIPRDQAQALVEAGHQTCPYSKAVHGNIKVTTTVV
jgi:organic hydroperoxide reductase OsmC/OhrA